MASESDCGVNIVGIGSYMIQISAVGMGSKTVDHFKKDDHTSANCILDVLNVRLQLH